MTQRILTTLIDHKEKIASLTESVPGIDPSLNSFLNKKLTIVKALRLCSINHQSLLKLEILRSF